MNKTEKVICLILGAILVWYIFNEMGNAKERAKAQAEAAAIAAKAETERQGDDGLATDGLATRGAAVEGKQGDDAQSKDAKSEAMTSATSEANEAQPKEPQVPEQKVYLENDDVKLELSTWGGVVKNVTLKKYAKDRGEISAENPAVAFDFAAAPLGELQGIAGLAANAAYEVKEQTPNEVVFANEQLIRKVTLGKDYQITYEDRVLGEGQTGDGLATRGSGSIGQTEDGLATRGSGSVVATPDGDVARASSPLPRSKLASSYSLSLGVMRMGDSKNDLLSVDSWAIDAGKGKSGVIHHGDDDSPLKPYLVGGIAGGCSGSKSAQGMKESETVTYPGAQTWVAVKNRFFVTALVSSTADNEGFTATVARDMKSSNYRPNDVTVSARFAKTGPTVTTTFFVGPKKQSLLWGLGSREKSLLAGDSMKHVMEFGMWSWLCYPLVWVLNFFNDLIPNFGVAIILLTILVRILFWPLTHKSTIGMKKMSELQPKMKAIQAKFKDNPQRLQQETWALYKSEKVNPLSSCLPMLIQIPVFIALFNVLRSAVELRYAPFLWIGDLSEPEGLFAAYLPFGGLNILPILMAVSTGLQSAFTPTAGDKNQQKMMMIFMPLMMLVMFYSFPSALSLYWFLSNLFSIVQMWLIRRSTAQKTEVIVPEVIDPPETRQMRRHG